tara:strand:- start:632 stop:892 length:261 start_codon:yes stop_codon:yes gene_type:complete
MKKTNAVDIVKKLNSGDRYVVTVSVLREGRIHNTVTSNNFLTLDLPAVRSKVSEEIHNLWQIANSAESGEDSAIAVTEEKLKNMLE